MPTVLLASAVLAALTWASMAALLARAVWKLPRLERQDPSPPARWPPVSLIVPARDEGAHLEAALRSKLALDYPALQVVLVDDRSTDDTGAIADRLAAEDARLTVVHVRELPDGWLGKVHALHRGFERATGEWVLLTDADIHYAPDTLRLAVAHCEARALDFLVGLPRFAPSTPLVDVVMVSFLRIVVSAAQADWLEDPSSGTSLGAGVFALARRSAYARTPGLEWLKMEIADDLSFGAMMKRAGARCGVVRACEHLELAMYRDAAALVHGVAKGSCAVGRYRLLPQALIPLAMLALDVAPWAALAWGVAAGEVWLAGVGALGGALQLVSAAIAAGAVRAGAGWALLAPLGDVFLHGVILVSGVAAHLRGGVRWRGSLYPMAALRAGTRFRFPWER